MGFQNLKYNPKFFEIFKESNDSTVVVNRIAPYVEQRMAKLTNIKYIPQIISDSIDPIKLKGSLKRVVLANLIALLNSNLTWNSNCKFNSSAIVLVKDSISKSNSFTICAYKCIMQIRPIRVKRSKYHFVP
jgi:hypothetical protein